MPGQAIRSSASTPAGTIPQNGFYPKLLSGDSGSVWLVTAPKTGVIVHLSASPQKAKHRVGYASAKLVEGKMKEYKGNITLSV